MKQLDSILPAATARADESGFPSIDQTGGKEMKKIWGLLIGLICSAMLFGCGNGLTGTWQREDGGSSITFYDDNSWQKPRKT